MKKNKISSLKSQNQKFCSENEVNPYQRVPHPLFISPLPRGRIIGVLLIPLSLFLWSIPFLASADQQLQLPNPLATMFQNVLGLGNASSATVIDIVFAAFKGFALLYGLLAFGFLVFSAFRMIISRGNEEAITKAKEGVFWSIWGFVIALLAFSIIASVQAIFGGTGANELANANTLAPPIAETSFLGAFNTLIMGILGLSGIAAIFMIAYSGLRMVLSAGNEEQVTKAKTILKWAVIGLVVVLLAYTMISIANKVILNQTPV